MEVPHWIDPARAGLQTAAGGGALTALLITKEFSWLSAFSLFAIGQMLTYWTSIPLALWLKLPMDWWPGLSFCIGLLGMFLAGGVVFLAKTFASNPLATVSNLFALWRGRGGP
jgi:hypothetical protein